MKIEPCDQGSVEWMIKRLGRPTASNYDKLLTPTKLKPSTSRDVFGAEILAAWELGHDLNWGTNAWVERGTDMEEEARKWYAFTRGVEVETVGFIVRDDGKTGGSPDGLVGSDGGLEIKCLGAAKHRLHTLKHPTKTPDEYVGQVQGYLYLTGREWWDLFFYNPELECKRIRVEPNMKWRDAFVPVLEDFIKWLEVEKEGVTPNLHPSDPRIAALIDAANKPNQPAT